MSKSTRGRQTPPLSHRIKDLTTSIPSRFREYINANLIDLSQASNFYKKVAAVSEELTDRYVEHLDGDKYRLKNGFDTWFFGSLRVASESHPEAPPNALAWSLFLLARYFAEIKYSDQFGDARAITDEVLLDEWLQSWARMKPSDWDAFRQKGSPSTEFFSLATRDDRTLDENLWPSPTAHHIRLGIAFTRDEHRPPEMKMTVTGDAAVRFMIAYVRNSPGSLLSKGEIVERDAAEAIFDSIVRAFKQDILGLTRPKKGRPRDIGGRAAHLLDHHGKKIRTVVHSLCAARQEGSHECDHKCIDRIKKSAQNYYKHLRRDLKSLVLSSQKEKEG
jgi:hypothetical protein